MKKALILIFIALFALTSVYPGAPVQAQSSGSKHISDIRIKGNSSVSTATIIGRLKMKPGDVFEESALNKELKRLYATGYFADVFVETEERPEGVVVIFTVLEKPVIGNIEFRGNIRIKSGRLGKKVKIKEGHLLDFNFLAQDVTTIMNYYVEQGYSNVNVDYKIETDPDTGEVTVVFLIDEGVPLKIKSIKFEGNKSIAGAELAKYMATKTAWWFIRKGALDETKFEADLDRIRTFYRGKGFLDARVTSRIDYSDDGKFILLTVVVDEGEKYLVGDFTIEGELAFPENEIRSRIRVFPGDPFDYTKIKEDVDSIRTFYYDKGYMNAEINLGHKYDSTTDRMNITYNIVAHDEVYVGKINVIGNTKTKDKVIRRELRVYPGIKYDGERLKYSKERIYNLGFFEDVYFETVPTSDPDVKDLTVTVKETKTGELSFGGGYSSVDSFIGFAQVRQRNFDILNFPSFTGSGQDLVIRAELGSQRTNYFLSWTDPWIFDFPYLFGADLYRREHSRNDSTGYGYSETRMGGSMRLGKDITDRLSTGLVYNLEEVKISNVADDAADIMKDEYGTNTISRVTWNMQYDSRDNKYVPTKGLILGGYLENAGGFIGGNKNFVKGEMYTSYYYSITKNVVLEARTRMGAAKAYGNSVNVPIYERFFAGGATTIRGYEERRVGPRDSGDPNIPIGGDARILGNVEIVFPVFKKLIKGAVFYDIGSVMPEAKDLFSTTNFKAGAGIGCRIKTPIGPVKLDWGYPLNENHDDAKKGRFYFSVSHGF
ncbi:MAG: outer membrane protein assembly factor BamA [Candidatus Omnitrophica bacterium]|nr:outer membrane protein assembly factor BamA [Candidatus Omnitrophota bacterium]